MSLINLISLSTMPYLSEYSVPGFIPRQLLLTVRKLFQVHPTLTGAGVGSKHVDSRNCEGGFLFDDSQALSELTNWIDRLYLGEYCHTCRRKKYCPDPVINLLR